MSLYVDGGRDIVIENNTVTECDLGIEVGAENAGIVTENIVVRNNLVYRRGISGLGLGPSSSVSVQLRTSSADCFGAVFTAPFQANDASELKAASD